MEKYGFFFSQEKRNFIMKNETISEGRPSCFHSSQKGGLIHTVKGVGDAERNDV